MLQKTKEADNNYRDSTSNVTLNQSNVNDSKLAKYSDIKQEKKVPKESKRSTSKQEKLNSKNDTYDRK